MAAIPLSVLRLPLSGAALRLYAVLMLVHRGARFEWPKPEWFADAFPPGTKARTIRRGRDELRAAELLHDGDARGWALLAPAAVDAEPMPLSAPAKPRSPFDAVETVLAPRRRRVPSTTGSLVGFAEFYSEYPVKKARADAEKAWAKSGAAIDTVLRDAVMKALAAQKTWRIEVARVDPRRFVEAWPYPATWLNGKRFEDVLEAVTPLPARSVNGAHAPAAAGGAVTPPVFPERPVPVITDAHKAVAIEAITKIKATISGVAAATVLPGRSARALNDKVRELRQSEGKPVSEP